MTSNRDQIKNKLIAGLNAAVGEKLPTSSLGRIGRTAFAVLRSGRLIAADQKRSASNARGETEIDLKKLSDLIASIGRLKGVAMKLGQIMSYIDIAMPQELRDALSVLQTHAQPMPFERVKTIILDELGSEGALLLAKMETDPISAASIGQVHKSHLADGTEVAVKIQYPEIAAAIEADFGPAAIGTKMASVFYPHARIDEFVGEARERFLEECDYLHEAHSQKLFRAIYKSHPVVTIPAVFPDHCSRRVLTTAFVQGLEFDRFLASGPTQAVRNRIGKALFEFYLGSLFRHQLYNCDPHPGNYLFLEGGRVALLDHGCTRQFETKFVAKLVNLTRAVHSDRQADLHQALLKLKMVRANKPYDYALIRGFLRSFFGPMLNDSVTAVDMSAALEARDIFKKKQQLIKFSLPGEFMFLFRIRFGLMSVLSRLAAEANWYQLERAYTEDFKKNHPILVN